MDKFEIRRQKLLKLIDEYANGVKYKFAQMVDLHPGTISHLVAEPGTPGKQLISEAKIDQIEGRLDIPGWFDLPPDPQQDLWPFKAMTFRQYCEMESLDKEEIEAFLKIKLKSHFKKQKKMQ